MSSAVKMRALFVGYCGCNVSSFVLGQRWISEAESDLGLGIVFDVTDRRLTLSFPAAGERRTYATTNAPVSRVIYEVDEKIRHHNGAKIKISRVQEQQGCVLYHGVVVELPKKNDRKKVEDVFPWQLDEEVSFPEFELNSFVQFSSPRDRLFAGQIDKHTDFALRYKTLDYVNQHRQSSVFGLAGPRVQLLPHQIYIANEVAQRHAPRVLFADEVGLGKTIEAGLVLHQQLISGRVNRALILLPASLQHQWLVEMLRRFNLAFTLLDEQRCQAIEGLDSEEVSVDFEDDFVEADFIEDGELNSNRENPFESAQLVICSLDFLTKNPLRRDQAIAAAWDMLLVDEAHHLKWSEAKVSDEYACVEALAKVSQGLLLLTATPEQLGVESHFARLRLLDPDRYFDLKKFIAEQASYQSLNQLVQSLLSVVHQTDSSIPDSLLSELAVYFQKNELDTFDTLAKEQGLEKAIEKIIDALLDRQGTGRVLFRNTRASVSGFPERILHSYSLSLSQTLLSQIQQLDLKTQLQTETFWKIDGADWWLVDPRVEWLLAFLKANKRKKVLVICAKADTAQDIEDYLRLRKGISSAVFHEGLNLIERDRAAAYFADMDEGAQVLVCSEIGSEGRNFQFAQDLVLFDIPMNPDLLEQRIGRLDRIGQTDTVNIHLPFYSGTAQEKMLQWYHESLNAFEKTCAIGQSVYQHFSERLLPILISNDSDEFNRLRDESKNYAQALVEKLQSGRDKLLELNSCKPKVAEKLVDALREKDDGKGLSNYLDAVFDAFGIDSEKHSEQSLVLHPSDHMKVEQFPGLPESGLTVTYSREQALSREDMQFLTWEHPLVRGAQDLILGSEFGNTAFCTLKLPPLKPGNLLLEAVYVLQCSAPPVLQLFRFIPQSLLRCLLDNQGKDLSGVLAFDQLSKLLQRVPRNNAQDLVRHARPALLEMLQKIEQKMQPQQSLLIANAQGNVKELLGAEIARMKSLAEVNPNVRQSEIDYLQTTLDESLVYLDQAQLRLDSLRVIMTL